MGRTGKIIAAVAVVAAAGATVLYTQRGELAMAMMERVAARNMAANPVSVLEDGLHVGLCGAGSPLPDPARGGPCTAVIAKRGDRARLYVVDSGTGGVRTMVQMQLPAGQIEAVLLTHFHSDHIDGLGEMAMQRWVNASATSPLPVHGPSGVERVVAGFNEAYALDAIYRTAHHGADIVPPQGTGMTAMPFDAPAEGESVTLVDADGLTIIAFKVDHSPISPAVGYRFDFLGRSLVMSGDTTKSDNLIAFAKDADLLLHEALSPKLVGLLTRSAEAANRPALAKITQDIIDYHTTPVEAAEATREANVGTLVFHHIVPGLPVAPLEQVFLDGVSDAYDGPVRIGADGDFWSLPAGSTDIHYEDRL